MKKKIYSMILAGLVLLVSLSSCKHEIVGSLSGTIIDSQTGYGMANVKVSLTDDMTVTNGDAAKYFATTSADGSFILTEVKVGTYRMIVEANGYFPRISAVEIIEGDNFVDQQTIVETPESGSFRIILIWGESPYDLDSHLTGPTSTEGYRFHVYYSTDYNEDYSVDLDVDDTYSYGPETITIHSFKNGSYRYSVHNYSDQNVTGGQGIYSSPAIVEIYNATGLLQSFVAPAFTGTGNTWRVCDLNVSGSTVTISPINEYVTAAYSSDTETFKNSEKKAMDVAGF